MRRKIVVYHIAFWITLYALWVAIFRSYSYSISRTMTIEFCYLIFITIDYYIINDFIVPELLRKKRYAGVILATVVTIVTSAFLRSMVALKVNSSVFQTTAPFDLQTLFINSLLNISIWVFGITLVKMLADRENTQRAVESLEKDKVKAELDFLKAQINPHAFFNSLNTIYGQIDKTNQIARTSLLSFSELLRYQLYECTEEKVKLSKEIEYLNRYVEFQRLRCEKSLVVSLVVDIGETEATIAPLLLVVLLENAFKFVSTDSVRQNHITAHIMLRENIFTISVNNTTGHEHERMERNAAGIGLNNLRRRLLLLYKEKHEFSAEAMDGSYEAHLKLDLA